MSHSCSSTSSTAARRKCSKPTRLIARSRLVFSAVVILASLASTVCASPTALPPQVTAPASLDLPRVPLSLDTRIPLPSGRFAAAEYELRRRQDDESSGDSENRTSSSKDDEESKTSSERRQTSASADDSESRTTMTVPVTRSAGSSTASSTAAASTSPLPVPFDDALPADFKSKDGDNSCPDFIAGLLADPTFKKCYPISMMREGSLSFFNAQKQLLDIVRVLDASCAADVDFCTEFLNEAARNLRKRENCGTEYNDPSTPENSPIIQAYNGLRAYNPMYKATCLQDSDTDMYCYASVVTNTSMSSDAYLYYLPYGVGFPGSSQPSCNQCTFETMGIFHTAAADRSQLIAQTYEEAALVINTLCGPNFVTATLPPAESFGFKFSAPTLIAILVGVAGAVINFI